MGECFAAHPTAQATARARTASTAVGMESGGHNVQYARGVQQQRQSLDCTMQAGVGRVPCAAAAA